MSSNKKLLKVTATSDPLNVEDVFSTHLYKGTGTNGHQIVNGIDLTQGGMVWIKNRDGSNGGVMDTARGVGKIFQTHNNSAEETEAGSYGLASFNDDGFLLNQEFHGSTNAASHYVSYTFRKAQKFFDVVTYSGTGSARTLSHSLGSVPGMVIIKRRDVAATWMVWHRSFPSPSNSALYLDDTSDVVSNSAYWNDTHHTASALSLGDHYNINASGGTYVAYIFGHDASDEGLIQCGKVTTDASSVVDPINLGFEPQWGLFKTASVSDWELHDTMRGWNMHQLRKLQPNTNDGEVTYTTLRYSYITSTGFGTSGYFAASKDLYYMVIRKAPMAEPTAVADVFASGVGGVSVANDGTVFNAGFPVDKTITFRNFATGGNRDVRDRKRGENIISTNSSAAQSTGSTYERLDNSIGIVNRSGGNVGLNQNSYYAFRRAPKFFDIVTWKGNDTANRSITHQLGAIPAMIWAKKTTETVGTTNADWHVLHANHAMSGTGNSSTGGLKLNATGNDYYTHQWGHTYPTSTAVNVSYVADAQIQSLNDTSATYVAYLFGNLSGISKGGSFSHTYGSSTDVDCGFSSGSRVVIVKRVDASGTNWTVWDTVHGIVSGNDPYLPLNSNSSYQTGSDYIDPLNSGFQITSDFSSGTFIYYAIAN